MRKAILMMLQAVMSSSAAAEWVEFTRTYSDFSEKLGAGWWAITEEIV